MMKNLCKFHGDAVWIFDEINNFIKSIKTKDITKGAINAVLNNWRGNFSSRQYQTDEYSKVFYFDTTFMDKKMMMILI